MSSDGPLQKADFGAIYDQRDPRQYFSTLEPFDYVIPEHGAALFARLLRARDTWAAPQPRILDVCCSYGIVATLMKTTLGLPQVYAHYRQADDQAFSHEQLVKEDRRLLEEHPAPTAPSILGLDIAPNAIAYALETGVLDAGFAENLEEDEPSAALREQMSGVDLITTTGGIGYVTEKTFARLLDAAPESVWVASFCLRSYDYGPIAETLGAHGLRTERFPRTFRQRRFTTPDEQQWALAGLRERGIDPAGMEAEGYYHAELYLSRPASEVEERPLAQLLPEPRDAGS